MSIISEIMEEEYEQKMSAKGISNIIQMNKVAQGDKFNIGEISDGYHTFDELYEHRIELYITLCRIIKSTQDGIMELFPNTTFENTMPIWKSTVHSDGSVWSGWFILGIGEQAGKQVSYHLPMSKWDECEFAETRHKAPEFDGHTSADVLTRLKEFFK